QCATAEDPPAFSWKDPLFDIIGKKKRRDPLDRLPDARDAGPGPVAPEHDLVPDLLDPREVREKPPPPPAARYIVSSRGSFGHRSWWGGWTLKPPTPLRTRSFASFSTSFTYAGWIDPNGISRFRSAFAYSIT